MQSIFIRFFSSPFFFFFVGDNVCSFVMIFTNEHNGLFSIFYVYTGIWLKYIELEGRIHFLDCLRREKGLKRQCQKCKQYRF